VENRATTSNKGKLRRDMGDPPKENSNSNSRVSGKCPGEEDGPTSAIAGPIGVLVCVHCCKHLRTVGKRKVKNCAEVSPPEFTRHYGSAVMIGAITLRL